MKKRQPPSLQDDRVKEVGTIRKSWVGRIHIGLVFPQTYSLAMSNLGYQTVYRLFNRFEDVVCERFCMCHAPAKRLAALESGRPLADFDIAAFSVAFENDYPHVLGLLAQARIPLRAAERGAGHPLILVGGVAAMLNPEPLAPFADLVLIGEAEAILPSFLDCYREVPDRQAFLKRAAHAVPGAYVPSCYTVASDHRGRITTFEPAPGIAPVVKLARLPDLSRVETASAVLTPHTTFADTCLIEVSRGCPHGCRFCSAGFVYRPPRFRDSAFLEASIRRAAAQTTRIGLVGAAVSDFPELSALCRRVRDTGVRFSFSSLRADALDTELLDVLQANRTKTVTIAPEAGTQRLRDVINKGLTETDILEAAEMSVRAGIPNLRLYFMVGLPTETGDDIEAVVALCRRVKQVFLESSRPQRRIGTLTVSANAFVPKPATPFQWAAMDSLAQLQVKTRTLRQGLKPLANVRFQMENLRGSQVQALLARGDRRMAGLLLQHHRLGGNWSQTLKQTTLDLAAYTTRPRTLAEVLPWDFIDTGVQKAFLWQDYQKALAARPAPPCPPHGCTRCGVCSA
jgi:radical SAM superfamily enzyme YgiQ (UPF0313 family)